MSMVENEEYKMDHQRRGTAVIFSHEKFKNLEKRCGTAVDVKALRKTYESLGFEVTVYHNLTVRDISIAISKRKFKQGVLK